MNRNKVITIDKALLDIKVSTLTFKIQNFTRIKIWNGKYKNKQDDHDDARKITASGYTLGNYFVTYIIYYIYWIFIKSYLTIIETWCYQL